jgi:hypothetical protein
VQVDAHLSDDVGLEDVLAIRGITGRRPLARG